MTDGWEAGPPPAANFWPTPDQELLLRAALLPDREAADAWRRLRPRFDLEGADSGSRRLWPLLYRNLRRHGIEEPLLARFREAYRHTWSSNQRLFHHGGSVLDALAAAGIDSMLLKGAALIGPYYDGDPGLRPMADFDIAVPFKAARRAGRVLRNHGWRSRHVLTRAFLHVKHACPFEEGGCQCDVHWRVFEDSSGFDDDRDFWAASMEHTFQGRPTRILSAADQLVHVCVHGARWTPHPGIRWVADATLILAPGGVDWRRVVEQAARRRFRLRMASALGYLRARLAVAVPDGVLEELASSPVSRLEHVERWALAREHRLLGQLPLYWCHHRRARAAGFLATAWTFPRYFQQAWGVVSRRRRSRRFAP